METMSYTTFRNRLASALDKFNADHEPVLVTRQNGAPEPLRHQWSGYWSRRFTREHRLVYKVAKDEIRIAQCRFHYG